MAKETLDFPPFPPLRWEGDSWVGEIALPSWSEYQNRRGAYAARSGTEPAGGTAQLWVITSASESRNLPTPEQVAAFRFFVENGRSLAAAVGQALVEYYPREEDSDLDELDDDGEPLDSAHPEELKSHIALSYVHLLTVARDGVAYAGFQFSCDWDEEHGAGVMTHRDRVVATGQADVSFLEWIAERDAAK